VIDVSWGTGQVMDSLSIETPHRVHSRVERRKDVVDLKQQIQVPEETRKKHQWGLGGIREKKKRVSYQDDK
jgi:hypothetical protein